MARRSILATAVLALALFGCSGSPSGTDQQTSKPQVETSATSKASDEPAGDESKAAGPGAKLVETGFGQDGEYAWVTSLVQNQSAENVAHFVTVQFNLFDKTGELIASEEQVETFSSADQNIVLGTQVDVPDKRKVAKVEATLAVGDETGGSTDDATEIKTGSVKILEDEYGSTTARFEVFNSTKEALKDVRVGVICFDTKGRVNGGGSDYPELIPPSGKVLSSPSLIVSGTTERCEAYAGPGGF